MKFVIVVIAVMGLSACTTTNKGTGDKNKTITKENNKSPSLMAPKVNKIWVPDKIEGDKYIEGHWIWVLEKTTSWSQ